jgi:rare lipoprotein A
MRLAKPAALFIAALTAGAAPVLNPATATGAERSGQTQRGTASFYHPHNFTGRPMANGELFDPNSNAAAHRTLPFGTLAEVTNLDTGLSRIVVIGDRGPHVPGRIIDVSPRTAAELGMRAAGLALVEVRPIGRQIQAAAD